jgi:formamidopyrimidine-DNA glycosylase
MLKPALMNQSILAGIGNILSDEILFQCRLHPKTRVSDLDRDGIKGLFRPVRRILRTEARARRESRSVPDTYLGPHRRTDHECPRCGGELGSTTVAGRTSHYCPACQGRSSCSR